MTKKDALVRDLAVLLSRHSQADWSHVATKLEEVARIARQLSEKTKAKRSSRKTPRDSREQDTTQQTPSAVTAQFAEYLVRHTGKREQPKLRDIALQLGIKADLPKNAADALALICQNLEKADENERTEKIRMAVRFVEGQSPSYADHYDRWVSLITKKFDT